MEMKVHDSSCLIREICINASDGSSLTVEIENGVVVSAAIFVPREGRIKVPWEFLSKAVSDVVERLGNPEQEAERVGA